MFRKLHVTPNVIIRQFLRGGGDRVTLISYEHEIMEGQAYNSCMAMKKIEVLKRTDKA